MIKDLTLLINYLELLGEKRLQDGVKHVEESRRAADVNFPEPKGESLLYFNMKYDLII